MLLILHIDVRFPIVILFLGTGRKLKYMDKKQNFPIPIHVKHFLLTAIKFRY